MEYTMWLTDDPESTAADANSLPDEGSMTIVDVIPTVGVMSPQGRAPAGTGEARWSDHARVPSAADSAYTVSFWVATKTWPL
jgi:hypothetical protein